MIIDSSITHSLRDYNASVQLTAGQLPVFWQVAPPVLHHPLKICRAWYRLGSISSYFGNPVVILLHTAVIEKAVPDPQGKERRLIKGNKGWNPFIY